ncbi:MAG: hypothetical protein Q9216_002242 [Gyalolechia sp. 2 TL-2023]
MDFVEGIGRQYLHRKANAVPQQLENLAKKQFKGDTTAAAKSDPATQGAGKDEEIENLKRELAEAKRGKVKPEKGAPDGNALADVKAKERKAMKPMQSTKSARISQDRTRPLEAMHERRAAEATEAMSRRGRSTSVQTATAAKSHSLEHEKHPKHRENQKPHNSNWNHPTEALPTRRPPAPSHQIVATASAHRDEQVHKVVSRAISERPRPATDLCLVEVIDEEPQRRQRVDRSGRNFVEVVEKDKYKTRYVIR